MLDIRLPDDQGVPYLEAYIGFSVLVYLFHTYLDARQLKAIKQPSPPAVLAEVFDQKLYAKTQAYSKDKWWYSFVHGVWGLTESLLVIWYKVLPWAWDMAGVAMAAAAKRVAFVAIPQGEISQTVAFVGLLFLASTLLELPWSLYSTFVVEERHGFNKQTLGLFVSDTIKQVLIGCVLLPPIVAAITYILQVAGPLLPLYLWGFIFALSLLIMTIYPVAIAPLFNNNAYMYGFFNNKRIVLYDTLIGQCSEEQVVAVLAHELGHWKLRHTPVLFTMNQLMVFTQFCLFTLVRNSRGLPASFGFEGVRPVFVTLILFQFIIAPMDEVIHYAYNVITRRFEFQADGFAVKLGHGTALRAALLKLEEENKSSMHVDPLYSAYHYSHPPLVDRLRAIDAANKKAS